MPPLTYTSVPVCPVCINRFAQWPKSCHRIAFVSLTSLCRHLRPHARHISPIHLPFPSCQKPVDTLPPLGTRILYANEATACRLFRNSVCVQQRRHNNTVEIMAQNMGEQNKTFGCQRDQFDFGQAEGDVSKSGRMFSGSCWWPKHRKRQIFSNGMWLNTTGTLNWSLQFL